ncbi:putative chromatin regulator PHD family [Helianthus annuus]|nr:putative chromatin regulator PHD family [Helianthus annuus]
MFFFFFFFFFFFAEGKLPADEPAILPPLPLVPKNEKRKLPYSTPQSKKLDYRDREWDHRDRDFELMPPPGGFKRDYATPLEMDQPIDPNEPTYCVCHQVSYGDMIACDNENVSLYLQSFLIEFICC